MIWHIVRFDCAQLDEPTRREVEADLQGLAALDEVAFLRLARDVDEPGVTGLLTGFASYADLEAYRVHPDHVPVVERVRALNLPTVRLDLATDDHVEDLP